MSIALGQGPKEASPTWKMLHKLYDRVYGKPKVTLFSLPEQYFIPLDGN